MILKMKSMKTRLEEIWSELESTIVAGYGMTYRRYSADFKADIFGALSNEEKLRGLAIEIDSSLDFNLHEWDTFRDINLRFIPSQKRTDCKFLVVTLITKEHQEIFTTLCEDLVASISNLENDKEIIEQLMNRLIKWQSLFTRLGQQGLNTQAQAGLYGECLFIKALLAGGKTAYEIIRSWVGPNDAIQDFQGENWAVEIKATQGKNHQKIHISNERQLDDSYIPNIFLIHYSLDVRGGSGISLNAIIDEIFELLESSERALSLFKSKLLDVGFFDIHKHLYASRVYSIRDSHVYRITDTFPKITERDIPLGVGDVKYSIILTNTDEWETKIEKLLTDLDL